MTQKPQKELYKLSRAVPQIEVQSEGKRRLHYRKSGGIRGKALINSQKQHSSTPPESRCPGQMATRLETALQKRRDQLKKNAKKRQSQSAEKKLSDRTTRKSEVWEKISDSGEDQQPKPAKNSTSNAKKKLLQEVSENPDPTNDQIRQADITGFKLTRHQRNALKTLLNPDFYKSSLQTQADAAGLSKAELARVKRDPVFQNAIIKILQRELASALPGILDASIKSARIVGREGFPDRQLLMQMGQLYTKRTEHEHHHQHEHSLSKRIANASEGKRQALKQLGKHSYAQAYSDDAQEVIDVEAEELSDQEDEDQDDDALAEP